MTRALQKANHCSGLYCVLVGLGVCGAAWAAVAPRPSLADKIPAAAPAPDLVLVNGKILTVDANDSIAEAIAIRDGKIIAVGSNGSIAKLASDKTSEIELYDVKLSDASSIGEIVQRVRERASTAKPGEWILGSGWDEGKLSELRYIYASDLDKVAPNNLEIVQRVRERASTAKPGEWILGSGWDEGKLSELRYIYASDLDKVAPNNP